MSANGAQRSSGRRQPGFYGSVIRIQATSLPPFRQWLFARLDAVGVAGGLVAAERAKALRHCEDCPPATIDTDQNEAFGQAIRALERTGESAKGVQHRQVKYLDKRSEADPSALKQLINPTRGFKSLPAASATIKGFAMTRMIRRGHCLLLEPETMGEVRFVNRLFRLAARVTGQDRAVCAAGRHCKRAAGRA
jgi:hypothetical protein